MNNFLRQATASQSRAIGPFIDDTDFKTAETGLTIANTDIKLVTNGATSVDKNSGGGTHRVNGVYGITFDATDTATTGEIFISSVVSGALPVFHYFTVLEEVVYDALYAASAPGFLQPTTAGRTLDVSTGGEAGVDWANIGSPTTTLNLSGTTILTATTIASILGAFTGSGINTVLGFFQALFRADVSAPSNIGGTYDPATTSLEAFSDNAVTLNDINAEVVDVLSTDTYAEPGQEAPAATTTLSNKIGYLYKFLRNKITQDSTTLKIYADNGTTVDHKTTVSDSGTEYTRSEIVSGP